eukprot:TRINITY_DN2270_c0_g1_i1.p1 TRINITY_DN2270_c0_g1~~TRINITY_DN2270_c0_g1_i1.p1  ORF type:complete len:316 (-),score=64.18 TRINITY_DN2270_c0_g1_i1:114-1061(-)
MKMTPLNRFLKMYSSTEMNVLLGEYKLVRDLGEGAMATVKLATKAMEDEVVAVKMYFAGKDAGYYMELDALRAMEHPNVIRLLSNGSPLSESAPTSCKSLVLEYCEAGDLMGFLESEIPFSESLCRHYFSQMVDAVEHIHQKGYCHRDLKPENMLLDRNFTLKIADFSHSQPLFAVIPGRRIPGTRGYQPPELLMGKNESTPAVDVFALGVILFMMATGRLPFKESDPRDYHYFQIYKGRIARFWELHKMANSELNLSEELRNLLIRLLSFNPAERPTIEELKSNIWMANPIPSSEEVIAEMTKRHSAKKEKRLA